MNFLRVVFLETLQMMFREPSHNTEFLAKEQVLEYQQYCMYSADSDLELVD